MLRNFFRREMATPIDPLIDAVRDEMHKVGVNSEEYPRLLTNLERLNEIKVKNRQDPVSRDTMAVVGGNLLLVLLMMAFESKHVMSRSVIGQIVRPRAPGTSP